MDNAQMLKPSLRKRQKRRDKRMHEELIECYRGNTAWDSTRGKAKGYRKELQKTGVENAPNKERMKHMKGDSKWQSDNLAPMIRFLEKHEGQFWDKVYSKLCERMDKNSLLGQHLVDHLFDFVETKASFEEGRLIGHSVYFQPTDLHDLVNRRISNLWYVHPKSGQLLRVKKKKRHRNSKRR